MLLWQCYMSDGDNTDDKSIYTSFGGVCLVECLSL